VLQEQGSRTRGEVSTRLLAEAATAYGDALTVNPDDGEGYLSAVALYQDKLCAYPEAFTLSQKWLERHPDDVSAQANFAEANFTTGRFA